MSMLADPRRKQKWTLNPRGKQWSEDSNKFGQKMLEKMGWSSGKGLGTNEQGMTEHVRVSLKNDMGGFGYKTNHLDKAWTEHQDSFNDFLQKLQQDTGTTVVQTGESKSDLSGKSLELKSKQSRARVHYQKFTRGKDVNKYSSKDLANIFGQKDLNISKDSKAKKHNSNEESSDPIGNQDSRGGVITINSGNMAEYFMKKGQDFSMISREKRLRDNDSESEPEYAGFGFASTSGKSKSSNTLENNASKNPSKYAFVNPCVELNTPENSPSSNNELKSSKKRKSIDANESSATNQCKKFKETNVNENEYKNGIVNAAMNLECQTNEVCNGKEFEVSRVFEFGLTNTALDITDEMEDKKRVRFNDHVEYSTDSAKKKKGSSMLDRFEVENKKAKKKKKHNDCDNNLISTGFVNEALDFEETAEEVHDNEINERKSKKSKKRKAIRQLNLETIVEVADEDKETCEEGSGIKRDKMENDNPDVDVSNKKKKKKKHKEKLEVVVVENNHGIEEIPEIEVIWEANTFEQEEGGIQKSEENICKKKNKKKKKNKDIEPDLEKDEHFVSENNTEVFNVEDVGEEIVEVEFTKVKRKKKKSKQENDAHDIASKEIDTKIEKEVSDKENTSNVQETEPKKSKKRKHRKSIDESINNSDLHGIECIDESAKETNTVEHNTPTGSANNERLNNTSSPWNRTARMPKRLLKSLFQRNSIQNFPGSNIHEIKGYGAEV